MIWFGRLTPPTQFSALPPVIIYKASPKAISGRTSYICVRLEFLRYPQLIPQLFNGGGFGPPQNFTPASTCSWIGHTVSGLLQHTIRSIKTRFPFGSVPSLTLNLACYCKSPVRSTKSTRSLLSFLRLYTHGFRFSFTPLPGSFSPFPHGTAPLSVTRYYLGLDDGPPVFPQGSSCPAVLWIQTVGLRFRLRGSHTVSPAFPCRSSSYLRS